MSAREMALSLPSAVLERWCGECGRFTRAYAERHGHVCGKALAALVEAKR